MNKVYQIITDQIIKRLEQGVIPWHKPWIGVDCPANLISKKEYKGINVFLLAVQNYSSPYWLTFNQCKQLGGMVKKGAKSTMIVFWKLNKGYEIDKETGEKRSKMIPILRYYRVFNVEQCENINPDKIPEVNQNPDFEPLEVCEAVIDNMPNRPDIKHEESRAYYHPRFDFVNMPKRESFDTEAFYYSVLFHELGHSTGHKSRLDRPGITGGTYFGSCDYSKEELVAEMTAAFLCGHCQIEQQTIDNSAAYIKSWLKSLKNDPKMVVQAAAQAQKASDYILDKPIEERGHDEQQTA